MNEDEKKQGRHKKLRELLNQLFVLESDIKKNLEEKFPEFSEKKQKNLLFVLEKALIRQNKFVEQALEKNPDLLKDIKHGVGEKMKELRKEEEKKNDAEELEILKQLEKDILGL